MPEQASSTVAPLRVGVVEDQPLYRDMIVGLLRAQSDVAVPLVASGAADARSQFFPGLLDVVILDVYLHDGNGLALGVSLRRADPNIGILLLSSHDVMELLLDLPSDVTGGWSYLSKTSTLSTDVVLSTLRAAARGETVVDPHLAERSFRRRDSSLEKLTERQYQVLQLVASGLSNGSIAERLGMAQRTVENTLVDVYDVLELPPDHNSRVLAVLRFIEETSRHDH
ncbi:response regulator transcription factor [Gryllotalpicola sp.]|uniref:response regulator n=1 Tax=Gryllotalpicola sp. TaxID=1932787 RepID=UPI0026067D2F|nr:response regulator transcription factor [Gryllotalpicola sp.]